MKGGEMMNVEIFVAFRIIAGLCSFKEVPDKLKPGVKKELENAGLGFLAE